MRDRELLLGCIFPFRFLNSKVFRISVKKELLPPDHPGIISNHLHKEVKVGDVLNVSTFYSFSNQIYLYPLNSSPPLKIIPKFISRFPISVRGVVEFLSRGSKLAVIFANFLWVLK